MLVKSLHTGRYFIRRYFKMRYVVVLVFFIKNSLSSMNWARIDSTCFQADKQKVDRHHATKICLQRGGVLHSVKNAKELVALIPLLHSSTNHWVSAYKHAKAFKWSDGRRCCPRGWWLTGVPKSSGRCVLLNGRVALLLVVDTCDKKIGFLCSKPAAKVWTLVNSNNYYFDNLCGVEIMPNCDGLPCEDVCQSHHGCDKFAKMANVCVNIKNVSQSDNCVVKLRPNLEFYRSAWKC